MSYPMKTLLMLGQKVCGRLIGKKIAVLDIFQSVIRQLTYIARFWWYDERIEIRKFHPDAFFMPGIVLFTENV